MAKRAITRQPRPPTAQAIESALQILLNSIEEESGSMSSVSRRRNENAVDDVLQSLQWKCDILDMAHTALSSEATNRAAQFARERNRMVPVNRLPFELTADILLRSLTARDHEDTDRLYDLSLVQVSWWHIIRAHAPFWTTIYLDDPRMVQYKLRKSRSLPLDLSCDNNVEEIDAEDCLHLLEEHRGRIRSLIYESSRLGQVLRDFVAHPMPLLEELTLRQDTFFQSQALEILGGPRLRQLELDLYGELGLRWGDKLDLGQLTRLRLSCCQLQAGQLVAFFRTLQSCSLLEEIHLEGLVTGGVSPSPPTEAVHLPKLQSLFIREVTHDVAIPFISLVHANRLTNYRLEWVDGPHPALITQTILDSSRPPPSFYSMFLHPTRLQAKCITVEVEGNFLRVAGEFAGEAAKMLMAFSQDGVGWLQRLGEMQHLSLSYCNVPLRVEIREEEDEAPSFAANLAPFTAMESLHLSCGPRLALCVIRALCKLPGDANQWSCHNLTELHLGLGRRVEWSSEDWCWDAVIQALTTVSAERNSPEAYEVGVKKLTLFQYLYRGDSRIVEDVAALFPLEETDSESDSGLSSISVMG